MPKRIADVLKDVLLQRGATDKDHGVEFADFKKDIMQLLPGIKEQSVKDAVYTYPKPWLRKAGVLGGRRGRCAVNSSSEMGGVADCCGSVACSAAEQLHRWW
jgi:hypothetical protein